MQILFRHLQRGRAGIEQMEMLYAGCNQHRPAPAAATYIEADTAAGRQKMPGKNAEIIVKYFLSLLLREMILVLPEAQPLAPETTRNPQVDVVVGASLHIRAPADNALTHPHHPPGFRRQAEDLVRSWRDKASRSARHSAEAQIAAPPGAAPRRRSGGECPDRTQSAQLRPPKRMDRAAAPESLIRYPRSHLNC